MTIGDALSLVYETHATSVDNEAGLASGWFDAPLAAAGELQARHLGDRRAGEMIAAVFCSDLSRAFRTADIAFSGRADIVVSRDPRLRECDYGLLTRRPVAEVDAVRLRYAFEPFPGGESYQQVVERTRSFLAELARRFQGQTVLVIGHRATFYALEHLCRGLSLETAMRTTWHWQPGWYYRIEAHRIEAQGRQSL